MRIAILTSGMLPIPAVQGGAVENKIDFLLEYNDRMKLHDITVYSPWNKEASMHPAVSSDVNHYVFIDVSSLKARIARRLYGYLHSGEYYNYFIEYYFEKTYAHLKNQNYDCIYLDNCPGYVYKLSQRGFKNIILRLGNDLLNSTTKHNELIFNNLRKILTCSNFVREKVSTIRRDDKIQTLYNGINIKTFSSKNEQKKKRTDIGLSEDDFVMVYTGRLNKEKGVSELIDAMLLLQDKPNIKLMIIGSPFFGNVANEDIFVRGLKQKAKDIKDRIVFTGFIPHSQLAQYLKMSDIAVIPSLWDDPCPNTVLEAQAMGLPLITTCRGGIPEEVTEKNAILLETDEHFVDNLAAAILDLYEHPEKRQQMASVALERGKLFTKEIYTKNFFEALETM
jgi:glycosyltransferase involved in cell wall biosynthesis